MNKKTSSTDSFIQFINSLQSSISQDHSNPFYKYILIYMRNVYSYVRSWAEFPVNDKQKAKWDAQNPRHILSVKTDKDIYTKCMLILQKSMKNDPLPYIELPKKSFVICCATMYFFERFASVNHQEDLTKNQVSNWIANNVAKSILPDIIFHRSKRITFESIKRRIQSNKKNQYLSSTVNEIKSFYISVATNYLFGRAPTNKIDMSEMQKYINLLFSGMYIPPDKKKAKLVMIESCAKLFYKDIVEIKWEVTNDRLINAFFEIIRSAYALSVHEKMPNIPESFSMVCIKKTVSDLSVDNTMLTELQIDNLIHIFDKSEIKKTDTSGNPLLSKNPEPGTYDAKRFFVVDHLTSSCPNCCSKSSLSPKKCNLPVYSKDSNFKRYIIANLMTCSVCHKIYMTLSELSDILARLNPHMSSMNVMFLKPRNLRIIPRKASNGFLYEPILDKNIIVNKYGKSICLYTAGKGEADTEDNLTGGYASGNLFNSNSRSKSTTFLTDMGYHSYLPVNVRQSILLEALETHPPREIVDLLNFFINIHSGNYQREKRYANAIAAWQHDLPFVHENRNIWYDKHPQLKHRYYYDY